MMIKTVLCVLVLILELLDSGEGQIIQIGQCDPNINLQTNFDIEEFQGQWFEIGRSDGIRGPDCSYYWFDVVDDDIQARYRSVNTNFLEERIGTASLVNGTAQLTLNFTSSEPKDFWILSTENLFHAIAFNCENISAAQRRLNIWTLGRGTSFPTAIMVSMINTTLITNFGVTIEQLRDVDHSDDACFILPVLEPGDPIVLPGSCDEDIEVVQNFDIPRFLGVWHEIASYESENSLNLCSRAEYSEAEDGIGVENSQVVNQTLFAINGVARLIGNDSSARLSVELNIGENEVATRDLYILATDYDNYAVSYTCENLPNNERRVLSWILGRSRQLTPAVQADVDTVIDREIILNHLYFRPANQSDEACFFFPDHVRDQPVVFRGLCELNIPVMANFELEHYKGLWHDIESYYSDFQTGTCSNAYYRLGDDVVDVLNTQVYNETLQSIIGEAVLTSTDGSGMLDVTFSIDGNNVTAKYWVIGTDYNSYALVYSCVNLDENERRVWAWKLSRTKTLTPQHLTAIDDLMSDILVLDNQYFEPVDQTREGCFFVPEPSPGVPVVFPGLCNQTVPVMDNFNLHEFQGTWHEIESYPNVQQQGHCINHQYSLGPENTLNLESFEVLDQFLGIANGTLNFTSTDGSARLQAVVNVDGETFEFPFWVLDTDYVDYALAYSCVQLNDDFRGIYSWKLSRSRELSPDANTAIDNVIDQVEVLDQIFYESIHQSDEACFFLPELEPGEPIILVGQCDTTITGIANFQLERYTGEWRLIESYPEDFQTGTCNRAYYSLGSGGSVIVVNSQVVDETLDTIEGSAVHASADGNGHLLVTIPGALNATELIILDTDYGNYSIAYACENLDTERRRVWSWKMSRTNTLTQEATDSINAVVNSINVLNNRYFYTVDNTASGCFYFPDPVPGTPVVFRGECDQTIAVMPNFNVTRYLGTWHNIEMYPSRFQGGTCSNAYYSLPEDTVIVINSQVVNQTQDTITGSAVSASADGSGRLDVTFPVAGTNENVTMSLWVLDTDYDSYSIVYACENQNEHRQVWSWKLSRRKQLSPESVTRINNTISSVQVLEDRYFWPVDQSDEGCFYFPVAQTGVPVEFPGRCDSSIPVAQSFNLSQFEGVWHEIATYPLGETLGDCSSHTYSINTGNALDLELGFVHQLSLNFLNGTLAFAGSNTDGRLILTVSRLGTVFEIPFWVLDVDYDDYALIYSCVELPNEVPDVDYRRIYSWKLSRSRQLSTNAISAIDSTISSVDVLGHEYYEDVDQSDDACFFIPEINPGQVVVFPGQCEHTNISVVQDFRADDYLGRWFLIESYPSDFQNGTCSDARYEPGSNEIVVTNSEVVDQSLQTVVGSAVASADGTGKLLVTFPGATEPSEYWILATDYEDYALVYSCSNINSDQRAVWSWKLSRSQTLSSNAVSVINEVVDSIIVLNERFYEPIDHSAEGCFYFPDPDPSATVRFRGQCNEQNTNAIPSLSISPFLLLWHTIETYPTSFQSGTCNSVSFNFGSGGGTLRTSQVINQTLDLVTMRVVREFFIDRNGELNITFPIGPNDDISAPLWIIATDYNSYALLYTCLQEDDEYMRVWSWKLSRTRELTPQAVTAINAVTSGIQIFDDRYYTRVDQSPEGCFFFPEHQPDQSVEFPGQCENISVVQDFNLTRFEGLWHEIEAYPNPQQQGQCINHEYTSSNNLLVSTHVSDLAFYSSQGSLNVDSTDGSARMTMTVRINGTVVTIPFWIVETDYDDYALAYSCSNIDQYFRRVFSWKLSRSKTLSPTASIAIDEAMSDIDVIDSRYFETVDQTDPACFFLPELAPGEPVVFPGQCDESIPIVPDFNFERFLNRWRIVETYESELQTGECIEATFSRATDGSVDVINTQVADQLLLTANGTAVVDTTDNRGILQVTFPGFDLPYVWVLDTDYDTFSFIYSCENINTEQRRVWSAKLSRSRYLGANAVRRIEEIVERINVLNDRYFQTVQQNDDACFYYPEPDGNPVIFRGQCDQDIAVVNNFEIESYAGTWYDVESYPQSHQVGTCPRAEYTYSNGEIEMVKTEVRAQELHTVKGTAVPAGNLTEGRLLVTFHDGNGTTKTVPYWILDTDYINYSLVYSCENINDEYRRVTSWKLSNRSPYLSNDSSAAIDAAMNRVPVLRQKYYEPRDHSEVGCFFYPDNYGGPVILAGQCTPANQVNAVQNFNASGFAGSWREVARFPSALQEGECVEIQYDFDEAAGNSFSITKTSVNNERQYPSWGTATVSQDGRGVLTLNTDSEEANAVENLYVLDVNYEEYALLYGCRNVNNTYMQVYSWKLARTRDGISEEAAEAIDQIVSDEDNLFRGYYEETGQDNAACFHYPDFGDELPDVITLPGPCDPTIRGVPDFNAQAYYGRWFEIERYPQPSQIGQCNRAEYTQSGSIVNVFNTEVHNQTLRTQGGTAVPAADGSGEFTVSFNVDGVTREANYYVLATDYNNFALVYSCRNLDNGDRQVSSWKLSRTRTLSATEISVINTVVQNTQGLNNDYYTDTDQSQQTCFYIPAVNENEGVYLRGTCAGITGQPNFNLQQYLGWWHDLRSYPTGFHNSECMSQQYREVNGQVEWLDTRVDGLVGTLTRGTVTATDNGRLTRTWEDGHQETLWVLATDYTGYALLFVCETVEDDDEYIRVWSSMQSKTRSLPADAEAAFAPIMATNQYLIDEFFLPVSQSDDACFYLPEPTGQQVILPGQCDPNIPVQTDFDIVEFTGTWYQIERYPYPEIDANTTCIASRVTGTDEGANILSWAVKDDELVTIDSTATVAEGSATLQITAPVPDTEDETSTAELHILLTDYAAFTLAYTCDNVNQFERVVVAFKLSRTKSLSAAANTAINNYMAARQELDQRYFIQVEQNEECEEPSSSYLVKGSIALILLSYALHMLM